MRSEEIVEIKECRVWCRRDDLSYYLVVLINGSGVMKG
jgi:hypothetical protein